MHALFHAWLLVQCGRVRKDLRVGHGGRAGAGRVPQPHEWVALLARPTHKVEVVFYGCDRAVHIRIRRTLFELHPPVGGVRQREARELLLVQAAGLELLELRALVADLLQKVAVGRVARLHLARELVLVRHGGLRAIVLLAVRILVLVGRDERPVGR